MANYLYNGVQLPDISRVWENSMQFGNYSYGLIVCNLDKYYQSAPAGSIAVYFVEGEPVHIGTQVTHESYSGYIRFYNSDTEYPHPVDEYWNTRSTAAALVGYSFDDADVIWTSHDILNSDGTLYLATSEPVPVLPKVSPQLAFTIGKQLGRRIFR